MTFINKNFLFTNRTGKKLYHHYAKDLPIIDYHCHLSSKEIYEDKKYQNLTELWLETDHYKWRAMRINGIDEHYITGNASSYDKFFAWAKTVPKLIGNPLYHWTHQELKYYFNIDLLLNENTAKTIWEQCNEKLATPEFSCRNLIKKANVYFIGTTDDPIDDLNYHKLINKDKTFNTLVVPTFRPDKVIEIENNDFLLYINKLSDVTGIEINSVDELIESLSLRIAYFNKFNTRSSDQSLEYIPFRLTTKDKVNNILTKRLNNQKINLEESEQYKTFILTELGKLYHQYNWVMQLHIGTMRNNSTRMFKLIGKDTGYDSMNDYPIANSLAKFLDNLDKYNKLPKTILYTLNPHKNAIIATMIGNFPTDGIPGKIQFGSAWWFNDNKTGILNQLTTLSNMGLLSQFIGMLTDSRSFLSFSRHDYFRRILCNLIGYWVKIKEIPHCKTLLKDTIQDICFYNAKKYFNID